ncbi:MAG TPA: hypothetical protein VEY07_06020 [Thermoplasmata archaeon]|nr:hypothetical protein [Thermoplasmata archaeon]
MNRRPRWTLVRVAALVIAAGLGLLGGAPGTVAVPPRPPPGTDPGGVRLAYNSTADGWPLSYTEFLPSPFDPGVPHPLAVYLHGMQSTGPKWVAGGVPSDFLSLRNSTQNDGQAIRGLLANASQNGFILIVPNTRTGDGFYTNTPCGGPQAQDIVDAVAAERSLRLVSAVYLIGFSMGSEGAFVLAATHPGLFSGIAVGGSNLDMFAALAYRLQAAQHGQAWARPSLAAAETGTCGTAPGKDPMMDGYYALESVGRLYPKALADVRIWISAGGADNRVPNNPRTYSYLQVNNSFVNTSCLTFPGEPAGCTTTYWALHNQSPGQFPFRFVWQQHAAHSPGQLLARDIFAWFAGTVPWGFYLSNGLSSPITPNPHPGR